MVGRITILLVFFSALLSHPAAVHEKKNQGRGVGGLGNGSATQLCLAQEEERLQRAGGDAEAAA